MDILTLSSKVMVTALLMNYIISLIVCNMSSSAVKGTPIGGMAKLTFKDQLAAFFCISSNIPLASSLGLGLLMIISTMIGTYVHISI